HPDEFTILVSGPNTGGKTVLIKAVGLLALLTQSGIIPPLGPHSSLPVFTKIFADIGDRQSIAASLSTFSAHVAVLREILDSAGGKLTPALRDSRHAKRSSRSNVRTSRTSKTSRTSCSCGRRCSTRTRASGPEPTSWKPGRLSKRRSAKRARR